MKHYDLWHTVTGYLFYLVSALTVIFVDALVAALSIIFTRPSLTSEQLQTFIETRTSEVMNSDEFIIRVVDGHLLIWHVSVTEIMQLAVLAITFIVTCIKAYIDIQSFRHRRQLKKRLEREEYKLGIRKNRRED